MAVIPYPWLGALLMICLVWSLYSVDLSPVTSVVSLETQAANAAATSVSQYVESQEAVSVEVLPHETTDEGAEESEESTTIDVSATDSQSDADKVQIDEDLIPNEILTDEGPESLFVYSVPTERPLILYVYSESPTARANIAFFLAHGLHAAADFVFILNGETDIANTIPNKSNIRIVHRENDCYDLGAYAEVLTTQDLYKNYKHFILLNASIRGPFLPHWAKGCWSDMYLGRVTNEVKLVGMTANCWPTFHVQSMIWATDIVGMSVLLAPSPAAVRAYSLHPPKTINGEEIKEPPGINACFHDWGSAVTAEVGATSLIKAAGYRVDVMMSAYSGTEKFEEVCDSSQNMDVLWEKKYFGTNVHPFETLFIKANRDIDPIGIEMHTTWMETMKYSSYDYCKALSPRG